MVEQLYGFGQMSTKWIRRVSGLNSIMLELVVPWTPTDKPRAADGMDLDMRKEALEMRMAEVAAASK